MNFYASYMYTIHNVGAVRMGVFQISMAPYEIGSGGLTNGSDLCIGFVAPSDITAGIGASEGVA